MQLLVLVGEQFLVLVVRMGRLLGSLEVVTLSFYINNCHHLIEKYARNNNTKTTEFAGLTKINNIITED